jgi:hypothetical protein
MTMVGWDHAGFAVDWDWQRTLTVWSLAGPPFTSRFDRRVLEHELATRPAGERQAGAAADHWWQAQGRSEALGRARQRG